MFKIFPVADTESAKKYTLACGAPFTEGAFTYAMTDHDTEALMGISQFEIGAGYGYIYALREPAGADDFEAMFILGRQTMSFIDTCGVHICRAPLDAAPATLMKAIGFKEQNGEYYCDMQGFFDGSHCAG